jgi:hypothetical protein
MSKALVHRMLERVRSLPIVELAKGPLIEIGAANKGADRITTHVKTMPNGDMIDVLGLANRFKNVRPESVPIGMVKGASRSKKSGFSTKRYEKANTKHPMLIDKDDFLIDGRHRYLKLADRGAKKVNVIRVSDADLMVHKVEKPEVRMQRLAKKTVELGYLGAGKPGYKRPLIGSYTKKEFRNGDAAAYVGDGKGDQSSVGAFWPAKSLPAGATGQATKGGIIAYPNKRAAAHILRGQPEIQAYGSAKNYSESVRRHEIIHSIRDHNKPGWATKHPILDEALTLKGELFGKRAKRKLGTSVLDRTLAGLFSLNASVRQIRGVK